MIELYSQNRTQSTLLIPNRLLNDFLEKTEPTGREIYFHFLLKRYSPLIMSGAFGKRKTLKIRFQNQGEDLIRKNFRPDSADWAQCHLMSDYLGISMTGVFTMLLTLDISDFPVILREKWYRDGVPPIISEIVATIRLKRLFPAGILRKIRCRIKT